jgi:hypothetical protein
VDVHYRRLLERCFGEGRRWIVAFDVLVSAAAMNATLRDLGASDVFVLAGSRCTGTVPDHTVDAVWRGAGVPAAPSSIVDARLPSPRTCAQMHPHGPTGCIDARWRAQPHPASRCGYGTMQMRPNMHPRAPTRALVVAWVDGSGVRWRILTASSVCLGA